MMSGRAPMRELTTPKTARMMSGTAWAMVVTICGTACRIPTRSSGTNAASRARSSVRMVTPERTTSGAAFTMESARVFTMDRPALANFGAPSTMAFTPLPIMPPTASPKALSEPSTPFTMSVSAGRTSFETLCAISRRGVLTLSYRFSWNSSKAELTFLRSPLRLFVMVPAMSAAAPSQFRSSSSKAAVLPTPSFRTRLRPLMESAVNTEPTAEALSASPMDAVAASTSARISVRSRKFPSASLTAMASSPIMMICLPMRSVIPSMPNFARSSSSTTSCMLFVRSRIMAVRAVPAFAPLRPWFAMAARRAVTVSTSCPAAFRLAALFRYASPSWVALVLLFACAYASLSANCPAVMALLENADR